MTRVFTVDRRVLASAANMRDAIRAAEVFDEQRVPDGLPFLLDDDLTVGNCTRINIYLSEAARQHALEILTLRNDVVGPLRRLLHFVRAQRGSNVCLTEAAMAQVVLAQHRLLEESKPNPVVRIDRGRGDRPDKRR